MNKLLRFTIAAYLAFFLTGCYEKSPLWGFYPEKTTDAVEINGILTCAGCEVRLYAYVNSDRIEPPIAVTYTASTTAIEGWYNFSFNAVVPHEYISPPVWLFPSSATLGSFVVYPDTGEEHVVGGFDAAAGQFDEEQQTWVEDPYAIRCLNEPLSNGENYIEKCRYKDRITVFYKKYIGVLPR